MKYIPLLALVLILSSCTQADVDSFGRAATAAANSYYYPRPTTTVVQPVVPYQTTPIY